MEWETQSSVFDCLPLANLVNTNLTLSCPARVVKHLNELIALNETRRTNLLLTSILARDIEHMMMQGVQMCTALLLRSHYWFNVEWCDLIPIV